MTARDANGAAARLTAVRYVGERRFPARVTARVAAVASVSALLLGFAVADSSAAAAAGAAAGSANATSCHGRVRRLRPGRLGFSFSCEGEDVTGFHVQANRALHSVFDPSYAFGCERTTARSFECEDIHSGAGSIGSGIATVSEPLCHRGAHLVLRVTPTLDFEGQSRPTFTLSGPC